MTKNKQTVTRKAPEKPEKDMGQVVHDILYRLTIVLIGLLFAGTTYAGAVMMILLEHNTVPHLIAMLAFVYGLVATAAWIADCIPKRKRKAAQRRRTR